MALRLFPTSSLNHDLAIDETGALFPKSNPTFNYLLIAGFCLVILLPLLGVLRRDVSEDIRQAEGRQAMALPSLEFKGSGWIKRPDKRSIKAFPRQFEQWFNDRIGFRRQLIQVFQVARYYGWTPHLLSQTPRRSRTAAIGVMGHLNQGPNLSAGQARVLIGRDGWLFYQNESVIDDYRGTDLFTDAELEHWREVLTQRRDWLAKRGIAYLFVVVPNKHEIYSEYLPRSINRVSRQSRLAQLSDHLRKHSDLPFLNLTEAMHRAAINGRVFHKTDTHWNASGAFVGAEAILANLHLAGLVESIPTREDYQETVRTCQIDNVQNFCPWVKMDLAVMLSSPIPFNEEVIDLVPVREKLKVTTQLFGPPTSDAERIQHRTIDNPSQPDAYMIHDSCMMALAPFLAPNFNRITYNWTDEFPAAEIEQARPAVVIEQIVQRRLMTVEPKTPPQVLEDLKAQ